MKGERLFRILGLVDEELIEEAVPGGTVSGGAVRHIPWRRYAAIAACLAVVCAVGWQFTDRLGNIVDGAGSSGSGINHSPASGEGQSGAVTDNEPLSVEGTTFMSYAGPVFPLTTAEPDTGLKAERTLTWDFAMGAYADGSPRQWGAAVTDGYVLTNPTDSDITVTALYPFAGSFSDLETELPAAAVDGAAVEAELLAGAYAGGFQGVWQSDGKGGYVLDGTTLNLAHPDDWTDFKALLESGDYLTRALGKAPVLDIPVTVYEFSDFQAPHEKYSAATQAVEFTIDQEKTTVLTYGFNGGSWDWETGWRQFSYFVPDGMRAEPEYKCLVVLGEDIGDYTLAGYEDGGCDNEIDGVSCTVARRETTLDEVLDTLCQYYLTERANYQYGMEDAEGTVPYGLFRRAVSELMVQYGVLSGENVTDRYADGRLDDMVGETMSHTRVMYLAFPVTVPAGGPVDITFNMRKEPSYDFGCSGSENVGLQGYDLVTRLGSTLTFTAQTAALVNTENVELVRQNLGFDLENGVTEVPLDMDVEHYYLEIRPKDA
ncbi:hypothetical protein [uncultured Dysosmobacter sp.]|uniref:hypothetical protein n=1 Tax=uncultured Dysosmobacter sp. TaxID=2591384 RepID=UPI0026203C28|nr:hypothetical protein [uncultured Dysosmobacter sp.]